MPKPIQWIRFNHLIEKWKKWEIDEYGLHQIIENGYLPAYVDYSNHKRIPDYINPILIADLEVERDIRNHEIVFNLDDVARYENEHLIKKPTIESPIFLHGWYAAVWDGNNKD